MPFGFFALDRWQLTSFCKFAGWPPSVRNPESKRYSVASNVVLFEECHKGDFSETVFRTCCF